MIDLPRRAGRAAPFDTERRSRCGDPPKSERRTERGGPPEAERLGDEIAELAARLHAATYELLVKLREFDELEGWSRGYPWSRRGASGASSTSGSMMMGAG